MIALRLSTDADRSAESGILEAKGILNPDKIEGLIERIRDALMDPDGDMDRTDEDQLKCAASLAHHGLLGSLTLLSVNHVDLSSIPEKHLVSLVSRVTRHLTINNVIGCDLVSLLSSLQCEELGIPKMSLGRVETQALV